MSIIDTLLKKEKIDKKTAKALKEAAEVSELSEEEILLEENILPEMEIFEAKSLELGVPLEKEIPAEIEPMVIEAIPKESAEHYKMFPINKSGNKLTVGMVYPEDLKAQEALNFLSRQKNFTYQVVLISLTDFRKCFRQYGTLGREVKEALQELESQLEVGDMQGPRESSLDIVRKKGQAPISKTVAVILKHAVEGKASDIHIEPGQEKTKIRFRLDGILHSSLSLPKSVHSSIVARVKIVSNLKIDEVRVPQDGRFSVMVDGRQIDFRVSTFPTTLGEKVVMRVLNPDNKLKNLEDLGLESRNLKTVQEAIQKPYGMILSTGPTGSGKTTTLYLILEQLNREGVNIVTLEDPVEYFIPGINQSQVKPEIGYTFATGLRHILRQDPDIIMVGEIRDAETANLAAHAALTGHIVLSTLHTNNAIGAIPRLIDLGIEPFLLPSTVNAIIAQRLVRKLCLHCKKKKKPSIRAQKLVSEELNNMPVSIKSDYDFGHDYYIWEPVGCSQCGGNGYSERTAVFEILKMTNELSEIILTNPSREKIEQEAKRQGMITIRQDGVIKLLKGETSLEEIIRVTASGSE
jgi:type IV pilus assembly protein PilB